MRHRYAGIDTHSQFHVYAITDNDGHTITTGRIDATPEGFDELLTALTDHPVTRIGIEGTSSYGTALTRHLTAAGHTVLEVTGPDRATRRRRGKSDTIDAEAAADAARTQNRTRPAKDTTRLHELRLHYDFRESAIHARTQAANQLFHAQLTTTGTKPAKITPTRARELAATTTPLASLARRWLALNDEVTHYDTAIRAWLSERHQALLDQPCVGPVSAAALVLAAGENPDRLTTEASFAALCGVSPIPASSGNHQRHRLNRHGDRRANRALWRIAFLRSSREARTIAYVERRTTQHKTRKEILRCLKRYIAREMFPILQTAMA